MAASVTGETGGRQRNLLLSSSFSVRDASIDIERPKGKDKSEWTWKRMTSVSQQRASTTTVARRLLATGYGGKLQPLCRLGVPFLEHPRVVK